MLLGRRRRIWLRKRRKTCGEIAGGSVSTAGTLGAGNSAGGSAGCIHDGAGDAGASSGSTTGGVTYVVTCCDVTLRRLAQRQTFLPYAALNTRLKRTQPGVDAWRWSLDRACLYLAQRRTSFPVEALTRL